jgi:K(+)-stimulated pyrophosphate-energized sodium pump
VFFSALGIWNENSNQNKKNNTSCAYQFTTGFKSFFGGGTVMGLGVAGLAVLGLTGFLFSFHYFMNGV